MSKFMVSEILIVKSFDFTQILLEMSKSWNWIAALFKIRKYLILSSSTFGFDRKNIILALRKVMFKLSFCQTQTQ